MLSALSLLDQSKTVDGMKVLRVFSSYSFLELYYFIRSKAIEKFVAATKQDLLGKQRESIEKLISYVNSFWFDKVGPAKFSVYGDKHRTNNVAESFHRSLNRKLIGKNLEFWKFIST